ncbi:rCG55164 [Rattus norvegicus]|uniref:RCG55164 n=1 Tax=Rattus norvegicus TaxID=10116 RepID=A6IJ97_RAT|nr:rCG55164 [Rattus norvegicus]
MEQLTPAHPPGLDCLLRDETWCLKTSILQASICPLPEVREALGGIASTTRYHGPPRSRGAQTKGTTSHGDPLGLQIPSCGRLPAGARRSTTGPWAGTRPQPPGPDVMRAQDLELASPRPCSKPLFSMARSWSTRAAVPYPTQDSPMAPGARPQDGRRASPRPRKRRQVRPKQGRGGALSDHVNRAPPCSGCGYRCGFPVQRRIC